MMEAIRNGMDPREAYEKNIGTYGRYDEAVKYIDPQKEIRRCKIMVQFEGYERRIDKDRRLA